MDDDEPPRKALEQPATPNLNNPSTSITIVNGSDTIMKGGGKERYRITVSFRDEIQKICWYGEDTPAKNIEDVIRTAFGLPHHAALLLKNSDGDVVAVSSSLPSNEIFHLQVGHATRQISREEKEKIEEMDDRESENVKHEGDSHSDSSHSRSPSPTPRHHSHHIHVSVVGEHDASPPISIKVLFSRFGSFLFFFDMLFLFLIYLNLMSFLFRDLLKYFCQDQSLKYPLP